MTPSGPFLSRPSPASHKTARHAPEEKQKLQVLHASPNVLSHKTMWFDIRGRGGLKNSTPLSVRWNHQQEVSALRLLKAGVLTNPLHTSSCQHNTNGPQLSLGEARAPSAGLGGQGAFDPPDLRGRSKREEK